MEGWLNSLKLAAFIIICVLCMYCTRPPDSPTPQVVAGLPLGWACYGDPPHEYYVRVQPREEQLELPLECGGSSGLLSPRWTRTPCGRATHVRSWADCH